MLSAIMTLPKKALLMRCRSTPRNCMLPLISQFLAAGLAPAPSVTRDALAVAVPHLLQAREVVAMSHPLRSCFPLEGGTK